MNKSMKDGSMWNIKPCKLAILVPTRDMVHTHFAFCLSQLIKTCAEVGVETFLFFDSSTILLNQRENLVENAKSVNADYMLWLDSDMAFPSTTALRLLEHNRDVVGCNYMRRSLPMKTVAYTDTNDWESWVPMLQQEGLVKVEGVGMGCILMKTEIFNTITKPYFEFDYNPETGDWLGEDFNLQFKLQNAGYDILIDTILSMEIKHMGIKGF